ncbi:unnamed protein product [Ixodes hexagonus]
MLGLTRRLLCILPQVAHNEHDLFQLLLEVHALHYLRVLLNVVQKPGKVCYLLPVLVDGILHQVVAAGFPVVLVLLAALAAAALHVGTALALTVRSTLQGHRAQAVAVACCIPTTVRREAVVVGQALVAPLSAHPGAAVALACALVAGAVQGAHQVAAALLAALAPFQVPGALAALATLPPGHVGPARALAARRVALVAQGPQGGAAARCVRGKAPQLVQLACTLSASSPSNCIVKQKGAYSRVTVGNRIGIDIIVAVTLVARFLWPVPSLRVAEVAIETQQKGLEVPTGVSLGTLEADDALVGQHCAGPLVGARARLAVVGAAHQRVAVKAGSAPLAKLPCRVMLANAGAGLTGVRLADEGVPVAVAGHAAREAAASRRVVPEARGARLAELAHVAIGAGAHLDPAGGLRPVLGPLGRVQLNVVDEARSGKSLTSGHVGSPDLDGGEVGQQGHELVGGQGGAPAVAGVLVEPEPVVLVADRGQRVALAEDVLRHAARGALEHHVLQRRAGAFLADAQREHRLKYIRLWLILHMAVLTWCHEVDVLLARSGHGQVVGGVLVPGGNADSLGVQCLPVLLTPGEGAVDAVLGVAGGALTDGRVAETEARCAAKLVVPLQVEEARAAPVALATLHVVLAAAYARRGVARRRAVHAARNAAAARPAPSTVA